MERIATQNVAPLLVLDPILAHITTGSPEGNASCRLHIPFMEWAWHVSRSLCVVFLRGTSPEPAFIWAFDVHLCPEAADGPVHIEIKLRNVDGATPFFDFFHAI